jgi:hypothetical protein
MPFPLMRLDSRANAVFLSYHRTDAPGHAGRLFDRLSAEFGRRSVFMDVGGTLRPGDDFVERLQAVLDSVYVLLAVIGPDWSTLMRRESEPTRNYVSMEIATGLTRRISVVPVLVHGAKMPASHELPATLGDLSRRQAVTLRDDAWDRDLRPLLEAVAVVLSPRRRARAASSTSPSRESAPTSRHEDIVAFMEARRAGLDTGQEMIYDPESKKFVVRPEASARSSDEDIRPIHRESAPTSRHEDIVAFMEARRAGLDTGQEMIYDAESKSSSSNRFGVSTSEQHSCR